MALTLEEVADGTGRLDDVVVGRGIGFGAVGPIPVGLAEDDVGPDLLHISVAEPEPAEGSGPEIGDHHIGLGRQAQEGGSSIGVLEVEPHAALVAKEVE